jgi:hypothetical protein
MTIAFWYWAVMFVWAAYALIVGFKNRAWFQNFYVAWNVVILVIFFLFLLIGLKDFPNPIGTLIKQ